MKIAAYVAALLAALSAGAFINGMRWESKLQSQVIEQQGKDAARQQANLDAIRKNTSDVLLAVNQWQTATQKNEAAYESLNTSILNLRGTVSGLRGDFSHLPGFLRDASQAQLQAYGTACTAVFERMANMGGEMAEAGGRISKRADGHAADAALIPK
jgi:hypothetical protein